MRGEPHGIVFALCVLHLKEYHGYNRRLGVVAVSHNA